MGDAGKTDDNDNLSLNFKGYHKFLGQYLAYKDFVLQIDEIHCL